MSVSAPQKSVGNDRNACPSCSKSFSRIAHLRRHMASHDGTAHWTCQYCGNAFQRRDVLNRHLSTCLRAEPGARVGNRVANRACTPCRNRKAKCDSQVPCSRCIQSGLSCTYSMRRTRRNSAAPSQPSSLDALANRPPEHQLHSPPATEDAMEGASVMPEHVSGQVETVVMNSSRTHAPREPHISSSTLDFRSTNDAPLAHDPPHVPGELDNTWSNIHALWDADDSMNVFQALSWNTNGMDPLLELAGADLVNNVANRTSTTSDSDSPPIPREHRVLQPLSVASGLSLVQLDPLEHHRSVIIAHLEAQCPQVPQILHLFRSHNLAMIVNTYFVRHHRHTPIIHLPTWNIATCSTALILSMSLVTASYMPSLGLRSSHIRPLLSAAYHLVRATDQSLQSDGIVSVETLQAMLLLAIAENFMTPNQDMSTESVVDFEKVVRLARRAELFSEPAKSKSTAEICWRDWVAEETTRRLAHVYYCLACTLAVLNDRHCAISLYEMQVSVPSQEFLYEAKSEAEWGRLFATMDPPSTPCFSILMDLILSGLSDLSQMPKGLLGNFAVIVAIFCYSWQARQQDRVARASSSSDAVDRLWQNRVCNIRGALRLWYTSWQAIAKEPIEAAALPMLYRDSALVWMYLAGIFTILNCQIASVKETGGSGAGSISVPTAIHRLILLLDQGIQPHRPDSLDQDYVTVHRMVTSDASNHSDQEVLLGSLYREPDAVVPGFT